MRWEKNRCLADSKADRAADFAAVEQAHTHFGRLDIVVNNAGYGQFGFIEEVSEAEARAQIETNVFGALWITQAALPYLRAQRSGHIVQVSSIGGITAFPNVGMYHASKWALEGFSQALAQDISLALWATGAGLLIATPMMILANDIHARLRKLRDQTERQLQDFLEILEEVESPSQRPGHGQRSSRAVLPR